MAQNIFNVIRSISTLWDHAQRMKHFRSNQKIQIQLDLYKEILPLCSCSICIYGDTVNRSACSPRLTWLSRTWTFFKASINFLWIIRVWYTQFFLLKNTQQKVLYLKEHLNSHRIYKCPHTRNTHTQMNNK